MNRQRNVMELSGNFTFFSCTVVGLSQLNLSCDILMTLPGNYRVLRVAELVGSRIPIHAYRCLRDPKCLFYTSGLSLCLSDDHFCLVPVDDVVLFHGMVCDG